MAVDLCSVDGHKQTLKLTVLIWWSDFYIFADGMWMGKVDCCTICKHGFMINKRNCFNYFFAKLSTEIMRLQGALHPPKKTKY